MLKYLLVIIFTLSFSTFTFAEETNIEEDAKPIIELMVTAKTTGMCGVFNQMIHFQKTTKMQGGDEFIVRFLETEAARLGHTLESFMKICPVVVNKYDSTMKVLGANL